MSSEWQEGRAKARLKGNYVRKIARKKGAVKRRIIKVFVRDGIEHRYHATKGWRYGYP